MAIIGLAMSGNIKVLANLSRCTIPSFCAIPAPISPPIKAWVVETGSPIFVAREIVTAAPVATLKINNGVLATVSGTRPFPEKCCTSSSAKINEAILPATVAAVAKKSAWR